MNQSKAFLTSLIFAGFAMFLVYFYVTEKEGEIKQELGDSVQVVVAASPIKEMEEIKREKLRISTVPRKFIQPGSHSDMSAFEGSVASAPINTGEQVLLTKVYLKGAETGLATQVAVSYRAVSVPISDITGVTRLIKPGDRVDIVAAISYGSGATSSTEVKTILQDVHILAVGERIQNQIPQAFETDPFTKEKIAKNLIGNRSFSTVTVEVSPQEAQSLIYVMQSADLYLTLRNPVDRVVSPIPTTTVDEVLGSNSKKNRSLASPINEIPRAIAPPPAANPFKTGGGSLVQ